jgi:hypothetical protein
VLAVLVAGSIGLLAAMRLRRPRRGRGAR